MRRGVDPQLKCNRCGEMMRLDDKDEVLRGIYKYWLICPECSNSCTVDGLTGAVEWEDDDVPF